MIDFQISRRRSQYDRGTSFAENEEFDFEEDDADLDYLPFHPCKQHLSLQVQGMKAN